MKERMKDELWVNKIKKRLENYTEPLPIGGWEKLEKELPGSKALISGERRIIPFRRWAMSVAAALLVVVSSVSFWLLQSTVGDEVRRANVEALAIIPDDLPKSTPPSIQANAIEPVSQAHKNSQTSNKGSGSFVAQQIDITTLEEHKSDTSFEKEELIDVDNAEDAATQIESAEVLKTNAQEKRKVRRNPSRKEQLLFSEDYKPASQSRGWSVGLSVGNIGGLGNVFGNDANHGGGLFASSSASGKLDLVSTANGVFPIPNGQELVFKDGMPYLMRRTNNIVSIDHDQPISFGLSVRKNLSKGFSVETGLTYTHLASVIEFEGSTKLFDQKLHYLGIPIRANWNFVDSKNFVAYVSAGGAVEKCVYGKIGNKNETVNPIQLSVMGAVGAQYNISHRVGVYVEPGVSYFFNDGAEVQTIRKENPYNFTLQAGIRLTY